jgi:hypothetical protein
MQMILVPRLLAAATANNPKLEAVCVDETWCPPTVENSAPFSLFYQVSFRFVSFRFVCPESIWQMTSHAGYENSNCKAAAVLLQVPQVR